MCWFLYLYIAAMKSSEIYYIYFIKSEKLRALRLVDKFHKFLKNQASYPEYGVTRTTWYGAFDHAFSTTRPRNQEAPFFFWKYRIQPKSGRGREQVQLEVNQDVLEVFEKLEKKGAVRTVHVKKQGGLYNILAELIDEPLFEKIMEAERAWGEIDYARTGPV